MNGKLVIFSAPSGAGKSTIINKLLAKGLKFSFSISATSRAPRGTEKNGVEYWFLSKEQFWPKSFFSKSKFKELSLCGSKRRSVSLFYERHLDSLGSVGSTLLGAREQLQAGDGLV